MKRAFVFLSGLAMLLTNHPALGDVVINEVYYHPVSTNLLEQWLELHNSSDSPVDVSGWRLTQDITLQLPTPTILPALGFLVIAANAETFQAQHSGIQPVASGWVGRLNHTIDLSDAQGNLVHHLDFYAQGDWATRVLGAEMYDHRGWEWFAPHDGAGASLELVNPGLKTDHPLNWASSLENRPTPGQPNSVASTNAAPLIGSVRHVPVLPRPSDPVTISSRVLDENPAGLSVFLHWRVDGQPSFTQSAMWDDGAHNDGLPADGLFATSVPPHAQGVVIEFFITAKDDKNQERVYPQTILPENSNRTANLLYQVDATTYSGTQPVYHLIMTEAERAELYAIGRGCPDADSDASMNATWITQDSIVSSGITTQVRYNASVCNRGHGSRTANPNNYHVNVPSDHPWKNQLGINLNSQYAYSQVLGSAIFRSAGVPMPDARPVQVRVNSTNLMALPSSTGNSFGSYSANEQYNNSFIKRSFPLDPDGNSYRGIRDPATCDPLFNSVADLIWHGANPKIGSYTNAYFKQNHTVADDWSDLITLLGVLNLTQGTTSETYVADVERVVNVPQWMRYLALNTLLDNNETIIANGVGDDYALYRGTKDTRFQLLPYDLDTLMGRGNTAVSPRDGIFRMTNLPVMDRFMKTPQFAPLYFKSIQSLAGSLFSSTEMNPLIDQTLGAFVPKQRLDNMKAFNASHVAYVLSQIPLSLTVTSSLPVGAGGYFRSTTPEAFLSGTANAVETRSVRVNGRATAWVAWRGTWSITNLPLHPGINRFTVESLNDRNQIIEEASIDLWLDSKNPTSVGGALTANTTWSPAAGPYQITSTLTVPSGITLTIEPGTSVFFASGVDLVVANGGIIHADGTAQDPIWISGTPGASGSWGGITINGAVNSPETRMSYLTFKDNGTTCIEAAGGTLALDHAVFLTTTHQYVSLDDSSFVVSHCTFPDSTAGFELVHGTGGIKSGGRGIVRDCFFGRSMGYNDIVDFTGGNRPQPIIHFFNNVFSGATDDHLDLDGTDAWIEGNIFLHCHRNGSPDSASAISGGDSGSNTSEITAVGNLFFDCDQAATAKEGNFYTLLNNTIVHTTKEGGLDDASGVVNVRDFPNGENPTDFGRGAYLEGNIVLDAELLARNYDGTQVQITWINNILPKSWEGPGTGNRIVDPMLQHVPTLAETQFKTWTQAQILRQWFALRPGSPALGAGRGGLDQGGVIPLGLAITGVPQGRTSETNARITVTIPHTGQGIPIAGFPLGSGHTHYRWSLDQGPWSAEVSTTESIALQSLASGLHQVQVIGKMDSGLYQNDPALGTNALVTTSRVWIVDPTAPQPFTVRLNELLAKNSTTYTNVATTPDLVELFNYGSNPVDLSGFGLGGQGTNNGIFRFPPNSLIPAEGYLVLLADSDTTKPGQHLGFGLNQNGDTLNLLDRSSAGGAVLDTITFGIQVADLSISRTTGGSWTLSHPTFGAANRVASLADSSNLRINEWLTSSQFTANEDFIELFNPSALPVALGGLYLSDAAGSFDLHPFPPLSFMRNQVSLIADGSPAQGANHLDFKLSPDVGLIVLSSPTLEPIDIISYGSQKTDVAEGRRPDGSEVFALFNQPTPGAPNPGASIAPGSSVTNVTSLVTRLVTFTNLWYYDQSGIDLGQYWQLPLFDDSTWTSGPALFYKGRNPTGFPLPVGTLLSPNTALRATYYFRTYFNFNGSSESISLSLSHILDDGAAVYLNGTEIYRTNLPTGTLNYNSLAPTTISDASQKGPYTLSNSNLLIGENVLAVEVHQSGLSSSDVTMALSLDAVVSTTNIVSSSSVSTPILLNEILVRNRTLTNRLGQITDWVELFNPSTNTVDLTDISLTTDLADARKWVFSPNTTLAADSLLILTCNPDLVPDATNTALSLKSEGGTLFLFDAPSRGGSLLDSLQYGPQIPDFSVARVPQGSTTWVLAVPTEGGLNTAAGLGSISDLHLNEWMANSTDGNDWFELFNASSLPVELSGLHLSDKLDQPNKTTLPPLSFIGIDSQAFLRFEADSSPTKGPTHTAFKLSAKGETIGLFSPDGNPIHAVSFGSQALNTSGGFLPDGSTNRQAFTLTSSPGSRNNLPIPQALINEVLTHTDPPVEDAIEFFNPTQTPIDIGGWYLSNSQDDLRRFRIPSPSIILPGGFLVLYQNQFGSAFTFNSAHGDDVYLSSATLTGELTGFRNHVAFPASQRGVSFGRVSTSLSVDFTALSLTTFGNDRATTVEEFRTGLGLENSPPLVGPVVINEIMVKPLAPIGLNPLDLTFIELANITTNSIALFDSANPGNTWKLDRGVRFSFPTNITLSPRELVLILPFDPIGEPQLTQNLITTYTIPTSVRLFGPYSGQLSTEGELLELLRADAPQQAPHPDAGFVPYVIVDWIDYNNLSGWPNLSLTPGSSLHKIEPSNYANDPVHWKVDAPTAGISNILPTPNLDSDHDGMPDEWEREHFLDPNSLADAQLDRDNDGLTSIQEFLAGTLPNDASSRLGIAAQLQSDGIHLTFNSVANRAYELQFRSTVSDEPWKTLQQVPATSTGGSTLIIDPIVEDSRLYRIRLVIPQ